MVGIIGTIWLLFLTIGVGVLFSMVYESRKEKQARANREAENEPYSLPEPPSAPTTRRNYRTADEVAIQRDYERMKRAQREQ